MQPHLPVWDHINAFHCRASGRCLHLGKVMGVLYPGPVGKHNLVSPLLSFWYRVPVWDRGHDGGRYVFGRHGATED